MLKTFLTSVFLATVGLAAGCIPYGWYWWERPRPFVESTFPPFQTNETTVNQPGGTTIIQPNGTTIISGASSPTPASNYNNPSPVPTAAGNKYTASVQMSVLGGNMYFVADSSGPGGVIGNSWHWSIDGGSVSDAGNSINRPIGSFSPGSHSVSVTVSFSDGGNASGNLSFST